MLPPLDTPDSHYLNAAQGWLQLGDWNEANEELERIQPRLRSHPEVLKVRWAIYRRAEKLDSCLPIATAIRTLAPDDPDGWVLHAQSLYHVKRYAEAAEVITPALERFPDDFNLHYDAACYACLLGDLAKAKTLLEKAFSINGSAEHKMHALHDPDFERLWREIGNIQ